MADTNTPAADQSQGERLHIDSGLTSGASQSAAAAALAESEGRPAPRPERAAGEPDAHGWWWGVGRRKAAVARVRIKPGSGDYKIAINRKQTKTVEEYFTEERDRNDAVAPLKVTGTLGKMDVTVRAAGGGYMGQAQAVRLGLARALVEYDPSTEAVLRDHGFLTRDSREVERKKYGQAGARRRFQFSKR